MGFVHLHLHTQYSLLDGANKVDDLIPRVKALGMPAVAMTDHGNMFGAVHFYEKAVKGGVKPIIGCEMYVAPGDRREKKLVRGDDYEAGGNHHLVLLAMNQTGYRNLCRLVTLGFKEGFYYKPRIDKQLLRELNEGLLCLSGCLASEVNQSILAGSMDRARAVMEEYRKIFADRYYIEIQDNHLAEQERCNVELVRLAREMSLPLVATNDCHYLDGNDSHAHEVLLCIQTGKTISDENRWKFGTDQLFVKGPDEMRRAFAECPDAVDNTLEVMRRCELEMEFGKYKFPVFQTPRGVTLEQQLERDARAGLERLFSRMRESGGLEAERERTYRDRVERELGVIRDMGFAGYFLIVADFTNYAKRKGIPVGPGRGSAAGSLVAYVLGITDLDPIPYNLLFERFLNPERKSMPDIDMDFCFERRDEVIRYVREKYGEDHVAQIITFGTLKGKAAIKDVGRVLDFTFNETDKIAKLYPAAVQGKEHKLIKALEMEPRLREVRDRGEREAKLFEHSLKLEGLIRHYSKHAAGIVIGARPLIEDLPLLVDKDGSVMTQYAGGHVELVGLIKFDFLGLKTLTMLASIVKRIRDGRGIEVNLDTLPLDDRATYKLIARGDTVGVFQMESGGMQKMLTRLRPSNFEEIIAAIALYRPGPLDSGMADQYIDRKNGKEEVTFPHKSLEPILRDTFGVVVYQEQVMQIAQVLAGYSAGKADDLRRAMGKKDAEKMQKERGHFVDGAAKVGLSADKAGEIFDNIEKFAAYGFNKSHSAAYAVITYRTAYLKAHYPEEFMAGLMTLEMGNTDKTFKNIAECRDHGIAVLPPDINVSREDFTVAPQGDEKKTRAIRFGLLGVKGVGGKAVEGILAAREAGPFRSLADFCRRTQGPQMNKKVVDSLIKCGAFDFTGESRRRQVEAVDRMLLWATNEARAASTNQISLFASVGAAEAVEPTLPDVPPWSDKETLKAEREVLGFYITAHPLDKFEAGLRKFTSGTVEDLRNRSESAKVSLGGVIQGMKLKNSKKGDRYANFTLEDKSGTIEVICWPETYRKFEQVLATDDPICVSGTLEIGDERRQIIADEVTLLAAARERTVQEVHFALRAERVDEKLLKGLRETLSAHRGECPAFLHLLLPDRTETVIALPRELRVAASENMIEAVERICGAGVASFQ